MLQKQLTFTIFYDIIIAQKEENTMYNIVSQSGLIIESFDTLTTAQEYLDQALRKGSKPGYLRIEKEPEA